MTLTVVGWADVFTRKNHKEVIVNALNHCKENKGLIIFAYCLMSNHLHLIANCNEPFLLKDAMRDFKKFTAKKILEQIETEPESRREWLLNLFAESASSSKKHKNYRFWQEGNHAIELFTEKFVWDKINYIHNNPVEAGFVKEPQEWIYSSATNYYGLESILEVECLSPRLITV
jgi:REP element-mobilizing transposase RayT